MSLSFELHGMQLGEAPLLPALSAELLPGSVLAVTGPSGCGKSSLLAWLGGHLLPPLRASGEIWLAGRALSRLPAHRRGMGLMLQEHLLFAHLSVGENIAFALPPHVPRRQRHERVVQALVAAGLDARFYTRDPASLSGGQRARVVLLRSLLAEPQALLLDEPFAALDPQLRDQFRQWVWRQVRQSELPVVLVTHHIEDIPHQLPCQHIDLGE